MPLIACPVCNSQDHEPLFAAHGNRGLDWVPFEHQIVGCCSCGLAMINPQLELEEYVRYYEKHYPKRLGIKPGNTRYRLLDDMHDEYMKFVLYGMRRSSGDGLTLLDVGCGLCEFLRAAEKASFTATGLEASSQGVKTLETYFKGEIIRGYIGDGKTGINRKWDIVSALDVIEHTTHPVSFLEELKPLVKDGGYIFISTPDSENPNLTTGIDGFYKFVHTFYFTKNSLLNTVKKAGLVPVALWQQPPVRSSASFLHPDNSYPGILHLLVKKDAEGVREMPANTRLSKLTEEPPDTVRRAMKKELQRGRKLRYYYLFWNFFPIILRVKRRILKPYHNFSEHVKFKPGDCKFL